jgi:hypothetical protein
MMAFLRDNATALQTVGGLIQAIFAIVLAVVAVGQLRVYRRMQHIMDQQTALSTDQKDLAEKQFLLTGRQTDLVEKQHGLTRLHFLTDKRPMLKIRHIAINHPTPTTRSRTQMFQAEHPINGSLVAVNVGGTRAKFTDSRYRFYWSNVGLPMDPPIGDDDETQSLHAPAEVAIESGESVALPIKTNEPLGVFADDIAFFRGNYRLYVMGYIRYSDWDNRERFMWFCRVYTLPEVGGGEGRFVPVENSDYESQD